MRKNLRAQFKFHTKYWKNVSKNAKDLIKQMLQPVPKDRITRAKRWPTRGCRTRTSRAATSPDR